MLWVNPSSGTIVVCFSAMTTPGGGTTWSRPVHVGMAEAIDRYLQEKTIAEQAK
jgi:hypothetical protein